MIDNGFKNFNIKQIIFVRHAEQDWDNSMVWKGRVDPVLTKNGNKQALTLAKQLS